MSPGERTDGPRPASPSCCRRGETPGQGPEYAGEYAGEYAEYAGEYAEYAGWSSVWTCVAGPGGGPVTVGWVKTGPTSGGSGVVPVDVGPCRWGGRGVPGSALMG